MSSTKLTVARRGCALFPFDEQSENDIRKLSENQPIVIEIALRGKRSVGRHRLFFGLLREVYQHQEVYNSFEAMRAALIISLGRVDRIKVGEDVYLIPKSISFAKMGEEEFYELLEDTKRFLLTKVVPLWPQKDIDKIIDMLKQ